MKRISIILSAFLILIFSACNTVIREVPEEVTQITTQTEVTTTETEFVTTFEEVAADIPTIEQSNFSKLLEAESGVTTGDLKLSQTIKGYSGVGYITGFLKNPNDKLDLSVQIPTNQHYNISLVVASEKKENNILTINDKEVSEFITSGGATFEKITIKNVYISKGLTSIGIKEVTGGINLDYVEIHNSTDITSLNLSASPDLINQNANVKTKNTMKYLAENYGKNVVSGQYASIGTQDELDLIYKTTGHYPAIRLGEIGGYTSDTLPESNEIEKAIEWSNMGGMVSYVWHWEAPMNESSYYSDQTTFNLSNAITDEKIATLSQEELESLNSQGKISDECLAAVKDIDIVSQQLLKLQENNVTVLWRPLHEASGGWFWWGEKGSEAYKWLWKLIYERQTNYLKLNNLIWVWNAQEASWYVGDDQCDIISADIYVDKGSQNSQVNTFLQLNKISNSKIIALSECANSPSPDNMLRDKAMWSWYGVWSGDYIMNSFGELSETYTTKQQLINSYCHENIITLEQLPDLRTWGN